MRCCVLLIFIDVIVILSIFCVFVNVLFKNILFLFVLVSKVKVLKNTRFLHVFYLFIDLCVYFVWLFSFFTWYSKVFTLVYRHSNWRLH